MTNKEKKDTKTKTGNESRETETGTEGGSPEDQPSFLILINVTGFKWRGKERETKTEREKGDKESKCTACRYVELKRRRAFWKRAC